MTPLPESCWLLPAPPSVCQTSPTGVVALATTTASLMTRAPGVTKNSISRVHSLFQTLFPVFFLAAPWCYGPILQGRCREAEGQPRPAQQKPDWKPGLCELSRAHLRLSWGLRLGSPLPSYHRLWERGGPGRSGDFSEGNPSLMQLACILPAMGPSFPPVWESLLIFE